MPLNTFEDKFEKVYGDIFSSEDFNLEKTDIKELKKAIMSGNESLGNKSSMDLFEINMSNFTYPTSPN
jgi:hypothetical protein